MIVLPSERRGRGYDSIESCDRLPLSQTLLAVVLFLPLSPPIDQRQGAIRTEIESRDSGNGRLPGVLVRFASDSPLEGDGFELPVPRTTPSFWPISTRTTRRDRCRKKGVPDQAVACLRRLGAGVVGSAAVCAFRFRPPRTGSRGPAGADRAPSSARCASNRLPAPGCVSRRS